MQRIYRSIVTLRRFPYRTRCWYCVLPFFFSEYSMNPPWMNPPWVVYICFDILKYLAGHRLTKYDDLLLWPVVTDARTTSTRATYATECLFLQSFLLTAFCAPDFVTHKRSKVSCVARSDIWNPGWSIPTGWSLFTWPPRLTNLTSIEVMPLCATPMWTTQELAPNGSWDKHQMGLEFAPRAPEGYAQIDREV